MNYKELKKILQKEGIGGWFGAGIRPFDVEIAYPTAQDMMDRVSVGMKTMADFGYDPRVDYSENGADCENSAKWLQAIVTFKWYLEHKGQKSFPAYPFGFDLVPEHGMNIGVTQSGILYYNYGKLVEADPKTIKEVEFY